MKKLFLGFLLLGLGGCAEEKDKLPAGPVAPGKLTSILADIHVMESRVDAMMLQPDTAKAFYKRQQDEILKKHQVTKADFDSTYNFYLNNVALLDKIYEGLVDTLSMREIKFSGKPADANQQPAPTNGAPLE